MKYHEIGKVFNVTFSDGIKGKMVAVEVETYHDNVLNENFRKNGCRGCFFCKTKQGYCSGHPYWDEICTEGGCETCKCTAKYREDGKHIVYKKIVNK